MNIRMRFFVLWIVFLAFGCSNSADKQLEIASDVVESEGVASERIPVERKIIKEGQVRFETSDMDATGKNIDASI